MTFEFGCRAEVHPEDTTKEVANESWGCWRAEVAGEMAARQERRKLTGVIDSNERSLLKGHSAKYISIQNVSKPSYLLERFLRTILSKQ